MEASEASIFLFFLSQASDSLVGKGVHLRPQESSLGPAGQLAGNPRLCKVREKMHWKSCICIAALHFKATEIFADFKYTASLICKSRFSPSGNMFYLLVCPLGEPQLTLTTWQRRSDRFF